MELIVQKAVELGAYQVIPVSTKRCVVKLDDKKAKKKVAKKPKPTKKQDKNTETKEL